jgi:hypothetical protein
MVNSVANPKEKGSTHIWIVSYDFIQSQEGRGNIASTFFSQAPRSLFRKIALKAEMINNNKLETHQFCYRLT